MEAGRELDALVAEHIFQMPRDQIYYTVAGRQLVTERLELYGTDIAAAWEVVRHLRAQYIVLDLQDRLTHWEATFAYYRDGAVQQCIAKAPTEPEAICLAALQVAAHAPGREEGEPCRLKTNA